MKSKEKREALFNHIDEYHKKKDPGGNNYHVKGKIGLHKILGYFLDPEITLKPYLAEIPLASESDPSAA